MKKKRVLKPVCTYQGGKQRYAKEIVNQLLESETITDQTIFYDGYCGSGAIALELVNRGISPERIVMIDQSMWGLFWKQIGEGSFNLERFKRVLNEVPTDKQFIQTYVSELAKNPQEELLVEHFLILQACSFGGKPIDFKEGKWQHSGFRNYWQPTETSIRKSPVNPMQPTVDELYQRVELLVKEMKGVKGIYQDIRKINFEFGANDVFYLDPPYQQTTGYHHEFEVMEFVNRHQTQVELYVSESFVLSPHYIELNLGGAKGGITAKKKQRTVEVLNIFKKKKDID